jgi:hypothetical protein
MEEMARLFRERVVAERGTRRRCRYSEELRKQALEYLKATFAQGGTLVAAAAALGVEKSVLRSWRSRRTKSGLRAVKVVDSPGPVGVKSSIVVHGPGGIRVEGLDVEALGALMRSLS